MTQSAVEDKRPRLYPRVLLSALLLTVAFPPADFGILAWVALAPLLRAFSLSHRPRQAFGLGYLFGVIHFGALTPWVGDTVVHWSHSPLGWIAWIILTLIEAFWF